MTTTPPEDLTVRLRALEAAATKGPWRAGPDSYIGTPNEEIADVGSWWPLEDLNERDANAAPIIAMRNAIPGLLDRIEQQAETIGELRNHIAEQITHVQQRIEDGKELGATAWRIALEDVARENAAALNKDTSHG